MSYNIELFYNINRIHHGEWYDKFMLLGTALGDYKLFPIYFVIISSFAYLFISHHKAAHLAFEYAQYRERWIKVLTVLAIAYLFNLAWVSSLKAYLHLPRPFVILPEGSVTIIEAVRKIEMPFASFPSGHSAFAMLMAAGLWPVLGRIGKLICCFYVVWVGFSRIALGVHFPADVIVSLALGLVTVKCVEMAWSLWRLKHP